jgi:hypothetical protein
LTDAELSEFEDLAVLVLTSQATSEQRARFGLLVRLAVVTIHALRGASWVPPVSKGGG